jgi:glycosyltransferase involved in cell wall biosynthesis
VTVPPDEPRPTVGVVLITHNQAWNVARLVGSVLAETAPFGDAEVVLVDAASTDRTAERAAGHPIEVLALSPEQPLTPAAGRYVGSRRTRAELLLFLDGDMELCPGWLADALAYLRDHPDVATLTGAIVDLPVEASGANVPDATLPDPGDPFEIPYTAGAALHRRSVLDEVGTFNPYLHSDEEPELCIRIRARGHRIVDLGRPLACHYTRPQQSVRTLVARWRRNLFLGAGQAIRYHLGDEVLWPYVRQRGYGLAPAAVAGLAATAMALPGGPSARSRMELLAGAITAALVADGWRKRSARATLYSVCQRLFILDGTIRGFSMKPHDPTSFPARFEVVRPS